MLEKVASTQIKTLILKWFGLQYYGRSPHGAHIAMTDDPPVDSFIIVRNPISRLRAAYLDKIVSNNKCTTHLPEWGCTGGYPDFDEFVDYVAAREDAQLDPHFRTQTSRCNFGNINYTIWKLEEIQKWFPQLIIKLNLTSAIATGWDLETKFIQGSRDTCFAKCTNRTCTQSELVKFNCHLEFNHRSFHRTNLRNIRSFGDIKYTKESMAKCVAKFEKDFNKLGYDIP